MVLRVCVQNFVIVWHGVLEEIGPRQNKQTLKYLVDVDTDAAIVIVEFQLITRHCAVLSVTPLRLIVMIKKH